MKIAHVLDYYMPHMSYQENFLPKKQKEMGHQVIAITSDRYFKGLERSNTTNKVRIIGTGEFLEDDIKIVRLPTPFEFGTRVLLFGLKKTLNDFKPDVVHCHNLFNFISLFVSLHKKKLGYRLIIDAHSSDLNTDTRSTLFRKLIYYLYRITIGNYIKRRADSIVAIGENERLFAIRELGLKDNEVKIIRLGADKDLFRINDNNRLNVRKSLKVDNNEILIIYTGKLSPDKDVDVLIRAFIKVAKHISWVKMIIIGRGEVSYIKFLQAIAGNGDFADRIIFHSLVERSELAEYFSAADIAIWPGNPTISFFEAMSIGLPLVLCDDLYNRGTAKNGNALFFERGDSYELSGCITKISEDNNLRKKMGRLSRELIEKEFNWDIIAREFVKIYLVS